MMFSIKTIFNASIVYRLQNAEARVNATTRSTNVPIINDTSVSAEVSVQQALRVCYARKSKCELQDEMLHRALSFNKSWSKVRLIECLVDADNAPNVEMPAVDQSASEAQTDSQEVSSELDDAIAGDA